MVFPYYANIMLNAFGYLSCFKLCWHNWPGPNSGWINAEPSLTVTVILLYVIESVLFAHTTTHT